MKYREIRVKKAGGGYRTQRAMVLASGKLKFVKNVKNGGASAPRKKATHVAKRKSKSITKSKRRYHMAKVPRRSRRRGGGGGGVNLMHLGGAALGLAYVTQNVESVKSMAAKIPGAKSVGAPAAIGIMALAVDRFAYKNKWLKLLGAAGIVLAAAQVGTKGKDFKWVGDGDDYTADVSGDDDDIAGDDDLADYDE